MPKCLLNQYHNAVPDTHDNCDVTCHFCVLFLSRWGSAPSAMSLRTSARAPVRGRGRVVRRGARGGGSGWGIGSRVVPATAVPEELVTQVSFLQFFLK